MGVTVEWTKEEVARMLTRYPRITIYEAARRSGWSVFALEKQFGQLFE